MLSNPLIKVLNSTDVLQVTNRSDFASDIVLNIISGTSIAQTISLFNSDGSPQTAFTVTTPSRIKLRSFRIGKITLSDSNSYTVIASVLPYPAEADMKPELEIEPLQTSQQSVSAKNLNTYNQENVDTTLLTEPTVPAGKRWTISGLILIMTSSASAGTRQITLGLNTAITGAQLNILDTGSQTTVSTSYVSYQLLFGSLTKSGLTAGAIVAQMTAPMILNAGDYLPLNVITVSGDTASILLFGTEENAV